jgi:dCTP deaminase
VILSDRAIQAAMRRGSVSITPLPTPELWSSTALDLRLDSQLRRWNDISTNGLQAQFCPALKDFNYSALAEKHTTVIEIPAEGYALPPRGFVLGWTIERIQLPHRARIAARVEGKSSLARLGLGVHITAPTIHAGFGYDEMRRGKRGTPLQLEIFNLGTLPIVLTAGMRICQLIFEEVRGIPAKGYKGQFAHQGVGARRR